MANIRGKISKMKKCFGTRVGHQNFAEGVLN